MNEHLDDIRRKVYAMEKDVNKRKVLKGTRYLLLGNGEDIFDKQHNGYGCQWCGYKVYTNNGSTDIVRG